MQMVVLHPNYVEDYVKRIPIAPNASQWAELLGMQEVVCIPSTKPCLYMVLENGSDDALKSQTVFMS